MDTETKASTKLAAIRTYAKDLDTERNHKSDTKTPSSVVIASEPTPTKPTPASDTLTAAVSKIEVPIVKPEPNKPAAVPTLKPIAPTKKATIIVDNEDAAVATIITDTKRDQFKLIPAIVNSVRGWFSAKKQDYAAKKIPKYTVPDTTRRKGIIQKATSKTGKFAASDFSSIQERILERKAAAAKAKEIAEDSSTIWTANTEPGFALLAETTKQDVSNVQVVPRKSFRTTPEEIIITTPAQEPEPEPVISPAPETVVEDSRWSTTEAVPTTVPDAQPVVAVADSLTEEVLQAPEPVVAESPAPEEVVTETEVVAEAKTTPSETTPPATSRFNLLKLNTNTLTLVISGIVLAIALLVASSYFMFYKEAAIVPSNSLPDSILTNTEVHPLLLYNIAADSIIEAFTTLRNERGTTEGVFMYTSTIGSTDVVVPTQILAALELELAPDFAQTISTVRVGFINQAPYLLLKIKDETAAKGGLLIWEATMYQELQPLLSLAPETTDTFLDATISGTDVRVLKNTTGSERLLYGIVSGTIVITTNSASYAQLTDLLK